MGYERRDAAHSWRPGHVTSVDRKHDTYKVKLDYNGLPKVCIERDGLLAAVTILWHSAIFFSGGNIIVFIGRQCNSFFVTQ